MIPSHAASTLHYTVKGFFLSAPLKIDLWQGADLLEKAHISSQFKYPPGIGKQRRYELSWEKKSANQVTLSESWQEKAEQTDLTPGENLDLVRFFWEPGYAETLDVKHLKVLWRSPGIICSPIEFRAHHFSFSLLRDETELVSAQGQWGTDGYLSRLKVHLPGWAKLGALTATRD